MAITRSHALAWARFVQAPPTPPPSAISPLPPSPSSSLSQPKFALVLEDDVEVTPHFVQALNQLHAAAAAAAAADDADDYGEHREQGEPPPVYDILLLHNEDVLQQRHMRRKVFPSGAMAGAGAGQTWAGGAPSPQHTPGLLAQWGLELAEEPTPYCAAACAYVVGPSYPTLHNPISERRYPTCGAGSLIAEARQPIADA